VTVPSTRAAASKDAPVRVLIASALEPEHVDAIAKADSRIEVLHAPELLPVPRYLADHNGRSRQLTGGQADRWRSLLSAADISFDFDWFAPADMAANCPNLSWVQATSSGIGQFLQRTGLDRSDITFTTAAGVHAVPLAEFALAGVLYFVKDLPGLAERQAARHWERYTARQLAGRRVMVVGLGQVGRKVAAVFSAMGAEVWGVVRDPASAGTAPVTGVVEFTAMDELLPGTDAIVACCPLTAQTRGLLSERRLRSLRPGAIVVNISRGSVIDEPALTGALADGHLGGACLDVAAVEPLPQDSPLWGMRNVIISPHSASTVDQENAALTDLFCDNLRLWLGNQPLRNLYSRQKGY
jgi:phosphoglycerate dehydrogenase-like enzyme